MSSDCSPEELLIYSISGLLEGLPQVTTGMASPIPSCAALLQRELSDGATEVSILASETLHSFTDGGSEIFDLAAQGRIGAFFLSGGQIDGQGNINLVGVGDYPQMQVRWSGSFGSAYLYFVVPRVILFRLEHTPRTMVKSVDFISAPGTSDPNVHRPGGPYALITNRCLFTFDKYKRCFQLASVHPGHNVQEVLDNTGFEFVVPDDVPMTPTPNPGVLEIIRAKVAPLVAEPYPKFAADVFGAYL